MNPVLMLTHNALDLTKPAVDSVLNQDIPVDLMVIDNGSTDGTVEWLKAMKIRTYATGFQMGVSRSWNYGLRYFFELGEPYVWVVNNDVIFRPDTYRELIADGGLFVTGVGCNRLDDIKAEFVKNIRPHPDFSCYLMRREVWDRVGSFDEGMVFYASDADMHLRMHLEGINAYTIGMPFYHYASGTLKHAMHEDRWAICHQADRDRDTFESKWGCRIGSPEYYARFGHGAPEEKE